MINEQPTARISYDKKLPNLKENKTNMEWITEGIIKDRSRSKIKKKKTTVPS
jgi:hypothetical protein